MTEIFLMNGLFRFAVIAHSMKGILSRSNALCGNAVGGRSASREIEAIGLMDAVSSMDSHGDRGNQIMLASN